MQRLSRPISTIVVFIAFSLVLPHAASESVLSYQLLDSPDGSTNYRLNISVSQSLCDYYREKNHRLNSNGDFANFVTPYALKPIADGLWEVYTDEEDFTNGVLMMVHQISYEVTVPAKYPVETITENKGDCDLFSCVAASVLKAGAINVVLLYYEEEAHMNIGVSLSHTPYDSRENTQYVTYRDVRYYIAECTGGEWRTGWRVGECPESLKHATAEVITLENLEQSAPEQVTASYQTLASSAISIALEPTYIIQGSTVTLSGQLSPALQNQTVTIYAKINTSPWNALGTAATDTGGHFAYAWNPEASGTYYIRASWSGDSEHATADSQVGTVTVLSVFFILTFGLIAALAAVGVVVFLMTRQIRQGILTPQPPEEPS